MSEDSAPAPARTRRRGLLVTARTTLAVLVVLGVSIALAQNWSAVATHVTQVSARTWALAILAGFASPLLTVLGWRALLADLGSPLHLAPASGIFLVGQLGKYLPGSVWSVLAQAEMASRLDIPRRRTSVAALVAMALALITGVLVGLPAVPLLLRRGEHGSVIIAGVAAVMLLLALWPPLLNRAIARGLRLLRREPLERAFSGRALLAAGAWTLLAWLATGAIAWAFAADLAPEGTPAADLAMLCLSNSRSPG